jgi:hypothetical protein
MGIALIICVVRQLRTCGPFGFHLQRLLPGGYIANNQQVVQSAHERQLASASLRQRGQDFRDRHAAESNSLGRVHVGNVGQQRLHVAHPADDLADGDVVDNHLAMLFDERLHALAPGRKLCRYLFVQNHHSSKISQAAVRASSL